MAKIAVILNQAAGAAGERRAEQLRAVLAEAAPELRLVSAGPGELGEVIERAASDNDGLVAAGGDGTVSSVAAAAVAHDLPFGVIPMGTLNHFAADAGLPSDPKAAAAIIAAGRTRPVDYATAGEVVFLNNASIGIYPTLVRRREKQERTIGKWPAAFLEAWRIIRRPLSSARFTITAGGRTYRLRTAFVFIGNNDYHLSEAGLSHRERLDAGHLSLFAFRHHSRRALLAAFIRSFFGFRNSQHVVQLSAAEITINGAQHSVEVACDGEVHKLPLPLTFRIHPGGLKLYAAPPRA